MLLELLSGIVGNVCRTPGAPPDVPTFDVVTTPSAKQQRAFELLQVIGAWADPSVPSSHTIPPGAAGSRRPLLGVAFPRLVNRHSS
jgi:hypothetical protein